jgi:tyrosine-protein kinase Etk/Wzc
MTLSNGGAVGPTSPGKPEDGGVDFGQLALVLRSNLKLILGIGSAVFALVMLLTMAERMTFRATGQLYLGELETKVGAAENLDISGAARGDIGSEVEILRSRTAVKRAILDSGLNTNLRPKGWKSPRFWQWLRHKRNPRILDVASRELIAIGAKLHDDAADGASYEVRIGRDQTYELWSAGAKKAAGRIGEPLSTTEVELTLMPGEQGGPAEGAVYSLDVGSLDRAADSALGSLKATIAKGVGVGEPSKVITLEFAHGSPRGAARFLRMVMEAYLRERQSWKTEDARAAEEFVTNQLRTLRSSLDANEQKISDYRASSNVVVMDSEAEAMVAQIGRFEEQRVAARLQVAALSEMMRSLKDPQAKLETFLMGEADDRVLSEFASSLTSARQQLSALEQRFNDDVPEVKEQRAQVESQLAMVRRYIATRHGRAVENVAALNRVISQYEDKLKTVPGAELGLQQLARETEVYNRIYSYLLERQQQTAIQKASTVSKNRILDLPQIPYWEDAPKLSIRMMSGLLGLLLGCLFVLVRNLMASTLQSESEIRTLARDVPVLASIPAAPTRGRQHQLGSRLHDVLGTDPGSALAEAFRALRANAYKSAQRGAGFITVVSSTVPGDGKTTVALGLAAMLAADKRTVLVIDADVRKPMHHELLRTDIAPGLTEVLAGETDVASAVQLASLSYGELFSMSVGKRGGVEPLNTESLAGLFAQLRSRFDAVIVDVAAFPLTSDLLALAGLVDGIITVARVGHTPRRALLEHVRIVRMLSTRYGIVANGVAGGSSTRYGQGKDVPRASSVLSRLSEAIRRG